MPEQFQGNSLTLLQAIYRNTKLDLKTRIDAAGKALPYEAAKPEPFQAPSDSVPLHERLKEHAREKAIRPATGKVVEMTPKQ